MKFSDVCGYEQQKKLIKAYFEEGIKRILVFGREKVGKTYFIEAMAGEFDLTIIKRLPESPARLYGIEDKLLLYVDISKDERVKLEQYLEGFPHIAVALEMRGEDEETLDYLRNLGFMDVHLKPDEHTIREFVQKKFNVALTEEEIAELIGRSFPYIENYIRIRRKGNVYLRA